MKTLVKLFILWLFLLGIAYVTKAQDSTRTPIGYDIDYAHLYIRIDTVHGLSYVYNYYPCKMYFSVNGSKAVLVKRKAVFTVWSTHFTVIVSRKKYRREYKV